MIVSVYRLEIDHLLLCRTHFSLPSISRFKVLKWISDVRTPITTAVFNRTQYINLWSHHPTCHLLQSNSCCIFIQLAIFLLAVLIVTLRCGHCLDHHVLMIQIQVFFGQWDLILGYLLSLRLLKHRWSLCSLECFFIRSA
jgi:hypothetical protein